MMKDKDNITFTIIGRLKTDIVSCETKNGVPFFAFDIECKQGKQAPLVLKCLLYKYLGFGGEIKFDNTDIFEYLSKNKGPLQAGTPVKVIAKRFKTSTSDVYQVIDIKPCDTNHHSVVCEGVGEIIPVANSGLGNGDALGSQMGTNKAYQYVPFAIKIKEEGLCTNYINYVNLYIDPENNRGLCIGDRVEFRCEFYGASSNKSYNMVCYGRCICPIERWAERNALLEEKSS